MAQQHGRSDISVIERLHEAFPWLPKRAGVFTSPGEAPTHYKPGIHPSPRLFPILFGGFLYHPHEESCEPSLPHQQLSSLSFSTVPGARISSRSRQGQQEARAAGWYLRSICKSVGRGDRATLLRPLPTQAVQCFTPSQSGKASRLTFYLHFSSLGLWNKDTRKFQLEELVPSSDWRHHKTGRTTALRQSPEQ